MRFAASIILLYENYPSYPHETLVNQYEQQRDYRMSTISAIDPEEEYRRRLEEYRAQLAEYQRNMGLQHPTTEPLQNEYDRRLQEYERENQERSFHEQSKESERLRNEMQSMSKENVVDSIAQNQRKDSYGGNMNQLVEYLPFTPTSGSNLCHKPKVANGHLKWMNAERPSHSTVEAYTSGRFLFECNEGFEHDVNGSPLEVHCLSGKLSEIPRCNRVQVCLGIPKPTHGVVDVESSRIIEAHRKDMFKIGTVFTFRCNKYARPDPSNSDMQSTCVNGGIWSRYPKCIAMITCDFFTYSNLIQKPTVPLLVLYRNVTIVKSPLHHGGYHALVGSLVRHRCADGFQHDPSSGPLDVACKEDGHWTTFPSCNLIDDYKLGCPELPDSSIIEKKNIIPQVYKISQAGGYFIGNITFACKDYYEAPDSQSDQPMMISCRGGRWTDIPHCSLRRLCTPALQLPQGARLTGSKLFFIPGAEGEGYLPGSFVTFSCQSLSNEGRRETITVGQISCQKDGSWNEPVACPSA